MGILFSTATTDVPYFGDCMETLLLCPECGFKHTDVIILGDRGPVRVIFHVDEEADLFARVVRSSSCTIRIPELGVLIEPGPLSESFVSNVEGVLDRVDTILGQLSRGGDEQQAKAATALMKRIESVGVGGESITLILEDPFGNSTVVHPDARRETLSPEEVQHLKTGITILDVEDLAAQAAAAESDGHDDGPPDIDDLLRP